MKNVLIHTNSFLISSGLADFLKKFSDIKVFIYNPNIDDLSNFDILITSLAIFNDIYKTNNLFVNSTIIYDNPNNNLVNYSQNQLEEFFRAYFEKKFISTETSEISEREKEIIKLVAMGYPNKQIADLLNISIHTVITHRKNISSKLGIKSIAGLTVYAIVNGLVDIDKTNL